MSPDGLDSQGAKGRCNNERHRNGMISCFFISCEWANV